MTAGFHSPPSHQSADPSHTSGPRHRSDPVKVLIVVAAVVGAAVFALSLLFFLWALAWGFAGIG